MFVLLDVGMDRMDGLVTLKKIKAMPVPTTVIMVTGNSEAETMKQAMALGAQDYINKPFSPAYLESVLLSKLYTG
jgi:two-component system C4-dicarboxylate transport response regulator DctD